MKCTFFPQMYIPALATAKEMCRFHSQDYIEFLERVTPRNVDQFQQYFQQYNVMEDCPIFEGLFEFCSKYTGGSLRAASMLNNNVIFLINNHCSILTF
jgi:histone deacetylase 3